MKGGGGSPQPPRVFRISFCWTTFHHYLGAWNRLRKRVKQWRHQRGYIQRAARRLQSLTNFIDISCVLHTYIPNLSWAHIFFPHYISAVRMGVCPYTDATLLPNLKLCIRFRVHLFGSFYRPKWHISLPFQILQLVKSPPFHTPEAWRRYYFLAEPPDPCNGHYGRTFASRRYLLKNTIWSVLQIYISKIQLLVYNRCCILIGWATTRLYVIAL